VLHFVGNLKDYLFHPGRGNRRLDAFLLSVDHAAEARDLVGELHEAGKVLVADNGNVDLIRTLVAEFEPLAAEPGRLRSEEQSARGHGLRPGEASADLVAAYGELAERVRAASLARAGPDRVRATVAAQAALRPSYLIGMEDFTIATLTALGVEPFQCGLPASFCPDLAERVARFAVDTARGVYGEVQGEPFAGVHAFDYDTAVAAGEVAGQIGVAGLATGLVGALQDRGYRDFRVRGGDVMELGRSVPRPYVRTMEILAGLHVGHARATGRRPRLHALGLGTPVLLPLLAALGDAETFTAADSTAPIVDAWMSPTISLYVDAPAPLKLKAHKIVQYWLRDGVPWDCPCPYCRRFEEAHPPRLDEAHAWWRSQGAPPLDIRHLHRGSPLAECLPLLGFPVDDTLRTEAAIARVRHNHWILRRIEVASRRHAHDPKALLAWAGAVVEDYLASYADPAWKEAVAVAWDITRGAAEAIAGAAPGGPVTPA
jgi:hypothetical protein